MEPCAELLAITKSNETYTFFSLDTPTNKFKRKKRQDVLQNQSLQFLESIQLMCQSLDFLSTTSEREDFKLVRIDFDNITENLSDILSRIFFLFICLNSFNSRNSSQFLDLTGSVH